MDLKTPPVHREEHGHYLGFNHRGRRKNHEQQHMPARSQNRRCWYLVLSSTVSTSHVGLDLVGPDGSMLLGDGPEFMLCSRGDPPPTMQAKHLASPITAGRDWARTGRIHSEGRDWILSDHLGLI
ncbi:hypothetical protein IAQ61_010857 [Plenodomus lingam]|uniref:uncharacterized protein n=1 Tax=Leptosphaeria maculans TaxID=5022 RepID=UPI0033265889|nr:hypothetical protein IAQ61_010857 [Plenodomus lingam]